MQLATDIQTLVYRHMNTVLTKIVVEYGSGNKPFTLEDCLNLYQVSQKLTRNTMTGKPNKILESKENIINNTSDKVVLVKTSQELCTARIWGSAKKGTAGLTSNQCKKKATNDCLCAMHFKKNDEQNPWHLGLITDDPPLNDHKGKTIKWISCVQIKKKKKIEPQVGKEPEDVKKPEVVKKLEVEKRPEVGKNDINKVSPEKKKEIMNELFGESYSGQDSDEISDNESPDTETYVFDGKEYQTDEDNNVYQEDTDGNYFKVGILIDGELVRD